MIVPRTCCFCFLLHIWMKQDSWRWLWQNYVALFKICPCLHSLFLDQPGVRSRGSPSGEIQCLGEKKTSSDVRVISRVIDKSGEGEQNTKAREGLLTWEPSSELVLVCFWMAPWTLGRIVPYSKLQGGAAVRWQKIEGVRMFMETGMLEQTYHVTLMRRIQRTFLSLGNNE